MVHGSCTYDILLKLKTVVNSTTELHMLFAATTLPCGKKKNLHVFTRQHYGGWYKFNCQKAVQLIGVGMF